MDTGRKKLVGTLKPVIEIIHGVEWGPTLAERLNREFPSNGPLFHRLEELCAEGIENGWMGLQGEEVRKGARVVGPGVETRNMSIDVVQLIDFTGPHHSHPNGEVCAVMAESAEGRFDGNPHGWAVYAAGSDHWPSGTGGRVRILFFLPDGAIDYTEQEASLGSGAKGGGC